MNRHGTSIHGSTGSPRTDVQTSCGRINADALSSPDGNRHRLFGRYGAAADRRAVDGLSWRGAALAVATWRPGDAVGAGADAAWTPANAAVAGTGRDPQLRGGSVSPVAGLLLAHPRRA